MRRLRGLALMAAGAIILLSAHADADDAVRKQPPADYYHICTATDLTGGTWKMVEMKEVPKRAEHSFYKSIRYQYIAFYPSNLYSFVASNNEINTPRQLQQVLLWPEKVKRTLRYTLDKEGVLNLYIDKKLNYSYRCLAITKDKDEFKKGDLVFRGYTYKSKTELFKLYRRWY